MKSEKKTNFKNRIKNIVSFLKKRRMIRKYNKKINSIAKNLRFRYTSKINKIRLNNLVFHDYWSPIYSYVNDITSSSYISESLFYTLVEPSLNRFDLLPAYKDKNQLSNILSSVNTPKSIIMNVNGNFFDENYNIISRDNALEKISTFSELIIKPSIDSGGGKSVEIIQPNKLSKRELSSLLTRYKQDYLLQELLIQHSILSEIYPNSLNTIRMLTLRLENKIIHVSSVVRFGNHNSRIDNQAQGGVACGIRDDGRLNTFAVNKKGERFTKHPQTNKRFCNYVIPNFDEIVSVIKKEHEKIYYFDIISWDIAVTEDDFYVIEMNLGSQEINFHQFCNGPLFGTNKDKVLSKISNRMVD